MFQTLLASAPPAPPSLTRLLASLGLHALALLGALALSATHPAATMRPREARIPLLLPPLHRSQPRPAPLTAPQLPFRAPALLLPVIDPSPLPPPEIRPCSTRIRRLRARVTARPAPLPSGLSVAPGIRRPASPPRERRRLAEDPRRGRMGRRTIAQRHRQVRPAARPTPATAGG